MIIKKLKEPEIKLFLVLLIFYIKKIFRVCPRVPNLKQIVCPLVPEIFDRLVRCVQKKHIYDIISNGKNDKRGIHMNSIKVLASRYVFT